MDKIKIMKINYSSNFFFLKKFYTKFNIKFIITNIQNRIDKL